MRSATLLPLSTELLSPSVDCSRSVADLIVAKFELELELAQLSTVGNDTDIIFLATCLKCSVNPRLPPGHLSWQVS